MSELLSRGARDPRVRNGTQRNPGVSDSPAWGSYRGDRDPSGPGPHQGRAGLETLLRMSPEDGARPPGTSGKISPRAPQIRSHNATLGRKRETVCMYGATAGKLLGHLEGDRDGRSIHHLAEGLWISERLLLQLLPKVEAGKGLQAVHLWASQGEVW